MVFQRLVISLINDEIIWFETLFDTCVAVDPLITKQWVIDHLCEISDVCTIAKLPDLTQIMVARPDDPQLVRFSRHIGYWSDLYQYYGSQFFGDTINHFADSLCLKYLQHCSKHTVDYCELLKSQVSYDYKNGVREDASYQIGDQRTLTINQHSGTQVYTGYVWTTVV